MKARILSILEMVVAAGIIIGIQVLNASKVDYDEFMRSWQTILGIMAVRGGVALVKK